MRVNPQPDTAKQRLILCLDGTWNTGDDSTNIVHHFALVREGDVGDGSVTVAQRKYYHAGVGTGVLDGISGGAFGFGLEGNVRDAYDWLVQNYREGISLDGPDEIYIFGFSRGAYTARSLVGFIGRCGLLRRAAPLTVNELWQQYCLLGRKHEQRSGRLERLFGETPATIRQINDLICDPWQVERFEKRRADEHPKKDDDIDRVPGQRRNGLNETEKLLVRWSRRVRITYLGVYDTVGAMGFDALAIPGLTSKLALHHNMRPTSLIQQCRHALALDEHRSSFSHTPFVAYLGLATTTEAEIAGSQQNEENIAGKPAQDWDRTRAMWQRKIEQRWFIGAHSNLGGGYSDNRLAQEPLSWLLKGAAEAGLVCEARPQVAALSNPLPPPRDSYAEFATPYWTMLFRAKRFYRPVDPEPELRSSAPQTGNQPNSNGFSLETINEGIDPSVFVYCHDINYWPPNLVAYAKRWLKKDGLSKSEEKVPLDLKQCLKVAAAKELPHPWLGPSVLPYIALVLWSTLAALGMVAVGKLVLARVGDSSAFIGLLCATAFGFSVVDWMESKVNFSLALGATSPRKRAFLDSIYWTRALGVVLCVFGGIGALIYFCRHGWNSEGLSAGLINIRKLIEQWWLLPVSGGLGALVATALDNKLPKGRYRSAIGGLICGAAVAFGAVFLIVLLSCFARVLLGPVLTVQTIKTILPPEKATLAGLLLLLELGAIYLLKAFSWCSEPMSKANLGSIVRLQLSSTPAKVRACLDGWCQSLTGLQRNKEAEHPSPECAMCNIVGEELWRDVIGLIPVYIVVLGMGLWFASSLEDWKWLSNLLNFKLGSISLWLLLPLAAAAADVIEDACHFQYLKLHARDRSPGHLLTIFSCTMSWVKGICFVAAIILTLAGILQAAWLCAIQPEKFGWRGIPAVLVFLFGAAMLVALLVVPRFYQLVNKHAFGKTTNGRS